MAATSLLVMRSRASACRRSSVPFVDLSGVLAIPSPFLRQAEVEVQVRVKGVMSSLLYCFGRSSTTWVPFLGLDCTDNLPPSLWARAAMLLNP
jgi:hypothetical protein